MSNSHVDPLMNDILAALEVPAQFHKVFAPRQDPHEGRIFELEHQVSMLNRQSDELMDDLLTKKYQAEQMRRLLEEQSERIRFLEAQEQEAQDLIKANANLPEVIEKVSQAYWSRHSYTANSIEKLLFEALELLGVSQP